MNWGYQPGLRNVLARSARQYEKSGTWVDLNTLAYEAAESGDTSVRTRCFDFSRNSDILVIKRRSP